MFNLTVNSTHVANSLNNTYVYNFKCTRLQENILY